MAAGRLNLSQLRIATTTVAATALGVLAIPPVFGPVVGKLGFIQRARFLGVTLNGVLRWQIDVQRFGGTPVFLVVRFNAPQNLGGQAIFDASRLVALPDTSARVAVAQEPIVGLPTPIPFPHFPAIREPRPNKTAIEARWRLFHSPLPGESWRHSNTRVTLSNRTELWHTRLAGTKPPLQGQAHESMRRLPARFARSGIPAAARP